MTVQFVPAVLFVGAFVGLLGGGVMFWMTRNWRAAGIVTGAALATAFLWQLPRMFE